MVFFRYIVSDVIEYMTPQSLFDSNSYGTYENYYSNKYNLEIFGKKDQPLLEVFIFIFPIVVWS